MTIPRVNGLGYSSNSIFTSAQATQSDLQGTWALDNRSGQSDTLASTIALSGTGSITVSGTGQIIFSGGQMSGNAVLSSELVFTGSNARFSSGNFLSFSTNSYLQLNSASNYIDCLSGSQVRLEPGATIELITSAGTGGGINVNSGGFIAFNGIGVSSAGCFVIKSGATAKVASGGFLAADGGITINSGGILNTAAGSTFTNAGTQTRSGPEIKSGVLAYTANRRLHLADAAGITVIGTQYDTVMIPLVCTTATRYILTTTPTPPDGCRIHFYRPSSSGNASSGSINVVDDSLVLIPWGRFTTTSQLNDWVDFEYSTTLNKWQACGSTGTT